MTNKEQFINVCVNVLIAGPEQLAITMARVSQ